MKDATEKTVFARANNIVSRLFKVRARSEYEIRTRLKEREIPDATIEKIIRELKTHGLIDDRRFTRDWIAARQSKPLGLHRITFELKQKGISDELVKSEIAFAKKSGDESNPITSLIQTYQAKHKNMGKEELKARIFGYLANRGFEPEKIQDAVEKL